LNEQPVVCINGELLALGPMRRDLAPLFLRWHNDFSASINVYASVPETAEQDLAFYDRWIANRLGAFPAYERETWRPVGRCSLNDIDYRNRRAEFGVLVGDPSNQGGYGSEMARLMLDYAFTTLGLPTSCSTVEFNASGIRAYARRALDRWRQSFFAAGATGTTSIWNGLVRVHAPGTGALMDARSSPSRTRWARPIPEGTQ
jgi:RimJ/RimL family protein N-acetyltransferase